MFFSKYLFVHKVVRNVDIPPEVIMENICDFEHVGFVHKKCFAYNKIIKRHQNITILEYGVRHIPFLPFLVTRYFMIHEKISPLKVVHQSKSFRGGGWIRSSMTLSEKNINGERGSTYTSTHEIYQPVIYRPFEKLIIAIATYWSNIVWREDYEICKKRYLLKKNGFKDGPSCGKWVEEFGQINFEANYRDPKSK